MCLQVELLQIQEKCKCRNLDQQMHGESLTTKWGGVGFLFSHHPMYLQPNVCAGWEEVGGSFDWSHCLFFWKCRCKMFCCHLESAKDIWQMSTCESVFWSAWWPLGIFERSSDASPPDPSKMPGPPLILIRRLWSREWGIFPWQAHPWSTSISGS